MGYRYKESGLDNVELVNGYTVHQTPYGEGVSIQDTAGLHQAIARGLIAAPKPLNGAELRFLRIELDMTQRTLAAALGVDEQAVRRWEKKRKAPIQGPADRLVRLLYVEYAGGDGSVRELVEHLAELDRIEAETIHCKETAKGWTATIRKVA